MDWTKTAKHKNNVATLHIGRDRIGVAIASHPELGNTIRALPPVKLELITKGGNQRSLSEHCIKTLASVCEEYEVGSFVVSWPVQKEGRAGASCGKVLHTLESLLSESDSVLTKNRPLCLWMGDAPSRTQAKKHEEDEWGRCASYSRVSKKTIHRASKEQYCLPKGCSDSAVDAWETFCLQYWPGVHVKQRRELTEEAAAPAKVRQPGSLLSRNDSSASFSHQDNYVFSIQTA